MNQNLFIIYAEILLVLGIITLFNINKSSKSIKSYVWIAFTIVPVIYFYFIIFYSTENIPFKDDYSLLESIYQMTYANTFSEWSEAFFKQINQHRFGFERSIMLLIYKALGNENIRVQIIIGNIFLLGILYFLFKIFKNLKLSFAFFTPLPLLLFNLTYFENATWGIAAIQNTPIIFFALLTVHFLSLKTIQHYYWAILTATITLFTSGNGIAIWLVGVLILCFQYRWKNLVFWILIMISLFIFYFLYDYEIISSDRTNLLAYPFRNIQYILGFWGNVFFQNVPHPNFGPRYWDILFCILNGLFLTIMVALYFWKMFKNKFTNLTYNTIMLFGGMAFLACTGLMFVLSRPIEINILYGGEFFSRRYMLFGAVFLCLGYLGFLDLSNRSLKIQKLGLICFIPIGLFLNISSYYTSLQDVYKQQQELKLDGYYWKNYQMLLSFGEKYGDKIGYNHPSYMINLINKLDSSGIYKLSQTKSLPIANLINKSNSATASIFEGKIDTNINWGTTIARESKPRILLKGLKKSINQRIEYFALKSQNHVFLLPAVPKTNSLKDCIKTQSLNGSGFIYETWRDKFPSNNYEVWVVEKDSGNNYVPLFTKKTIQL